MEHEGSSSRLLRRRRFDVADLGRMTEAGVLSADERLELIEGELVEMGVPGPRHSGRVDRLARLLGVGELWVLDLRGRRLFAFADPHDGGYRQRRCLDQEGELLVPADGRLRVAELLA